MPAPANPLPAPRHALTGPGPDDPALPPCDLSRRTVRVTERRADGLVAFEFSMGWPDLVVELLMPAAAFDEFCAAQRAQLISD